MIDNPYSSFDIKGKVALVVGATGAFGSVAASTYAGAGCKAQCSIYCQNFFKEDQTCDNECNYAACDYDGGACSERR